MAAREVVRTSHQTRDVYVYGISMGSLAFVFSIVWAMFAVANALDLGFEWLSLAIAFHAAGNLLGGVRTAKQHPLEETVPDEEG